MSLPQLNADLRYNVTLPISEEKIEVRPYLVKEEKILLTAMESENKADIALAIDKILQNCTFGKDMKNYPLLDIEYLMLKLKMFSAGEVIPVHVRCKHKVDKPTLNEQTGEMENKPEECSHISTVDVNLEKELVIDKKKIKSNKVQLTDSVGVVLRPPTFSLFADALSAERPSELTFNVLTNCLDHVWNGDEIIRDFTYEEATAFLEGLNKKQLIPIKKYIESIPKLQIIRDFKCEACGYEQILKLENFFDFFTD